MPMSLKLIDVLVAVVVVVFSSILQVRHTSDE